MSDLKQKLKESVEGNLEREQKDLKESDDELKMLKANLAVEHKLAKAINLKEELKEELKYSIQALESMIVMEENRNNKTKINIEMLQHKLGAVNGCTDVELELSAQK